MSTDIPNVTGESLTTTYFELEDPGYIEESLVGFDFLTTFVFLLSIVGISGNSFVLLVYTRSKQLHDATTKFILNLAVTDLITAIFICVYEILLLVDITLTSTSKILCLFWEQVLTLMMFVSQSLIAVATFDRYIAVCHPILYPKIMTNRLVRFLLVSAWIFPVCLATIPFFGFNNFEHLPLCIFEVLLPDWLYITLSSIMILLMAVPFTLYILIFKTALSFYRRFNDAKGKTGENAADDARNRERKKAIKNGKIMGTVNLLFIICWLPFQICQFFLGSNFDDSFRDAVAASYYLGVLNCTVNPFIYAWQKKKFKEEAKKILTCRRKPQGKSEKMHQKDEGYINKNKEIPIPDLTEKKAKKAKETECKTQSGIIGMRVITGITGTNGDNDSIGDSGSTVMRVYTGITGSNWVNDSIGDSGSIGTNDGRGISGTRILDNVRSSDGTWANNSTVTSDNTGVTCIGSTEIRGSSY